MFSKNSLNVFVMFEKGGEVIWMNDKILYWLDEVLEAVLSVAVLSSTI